MWEMSEGWRTRVFRFAMGCAAVAGLCTLLTWAAPFPLVSDGKGGYSGAANFYVAMAALLFAFLAAGWAPMAVEEAASSLWLVVLCCLCWLGLGFCPRGMESAFPQRLKPLVLGWAGWPG